MKNENALYHLSITLFLLFLLGSVTFLVVFKISALFIAFAAVLVAVLFSSIAHFLSAKLPLSYRWAYAMTLGLLVLLMGVVVFLLWASVSLQWDELKESLPQAFESLANRLEEQGWLTQLTEMIKTQVQEKGLSFGLVTATGFLAGLGSLLVMSILAIYMGLEPELYKKGIYVCFPKHQKTFKTFFDASYKQLRHWLSGKLLAMLVISGLTVLGLWALQVKLALILGLLAGLLSFIPNFGPLIAVIPAALLGFSENSTTGWLVLGLFALIQFVESYLLLPLLYKEKVKLPPALTLFAQVLLGMLFGLWGLALAAPLAAVSIVIVQTTKISHEKT